MFPFSRTLRLALASVIATSSVLFGIQAPAVAAEAAPVVSAPAQTNAADIVDVGDPALESEPQLSIAGQIRVAILDEKTTSRTEYAVITPSGDAVAIAGELPDAVSSGDEFAGTVAIPAVVVDAVDDGHDAEIDESSTTPIDVTSAAGTQIIELAAATEPLEIVAGTVEMTTVAAAAIPRGHTVDVAIATGTVFSDSEVDTLVAGLDAFWTSQSAGVITSVSRSGTIQRNVNPSCDHDSFWSAAASRFGRTASSYWDNGRGEHLLVLTNDNCGTGLGTIGNQVHSGGLIWASVADEVDLHTSGHEFGHNLGLGHSNVHECAEPARAEGSPEQGCDELEYSDYFDVMSGGFQACIPECVTTNKLGALNATHKRSLGFLPSGSTRTITETTTTVIQAAAAGSGLRALEVTDPISGRLYEVEFRSGTGMDSGTFYANSSLWNYDLRLGIGVRVLTTRMDDGVPTSVAIAQALPAGQSNKKLVLREAQTFTSESGAVRITVTAQSSTTATVTIELSGPSTVNRIEGEDRYATAVAVARAGYPGTANVVYLASGANFPDALSAAPAAVKTGGPLLLTPSDHLPASVQKALTDLNPSRVVVVGGSLAVSPAVVTQIGTLGWSGAAPEVTRIQGGDRFETARAVVRSAFTTASRAYIASGANFPDALSAAAAGGAKGAPVILIDGSTSSIDAETRTLLTDLGVTQITIAGGPAAISAGIESSLRTIGSVTRLSGSDRFATSLAISDDAFPAPTEVFLAMGFQFPDALAGATLAGTRGAPLYVVQPACIPSAIRSAIYSGGASTVTLIGGVAALNASVAALRSC